MRHFICVLLSLCAIEAWALPSAPHGLQDQDLENEQLLYLASLGGTFSQTGIASMYDEPQAIACGPGRFNPNAMTAAHKTLPCWSKARVTNLSNGRSTIVTINDRGPYVAGRIIDLSKASFRAIGAPGAGLMRVRVEALGRGNDSRHRHRNVDEWNAASTK